MSQGSKLWATGEAYEPYVGRWSRLVAPEFVRWLDIPPDRDWVDVGCGTGELTAAILANSDPRSVQGIDPSEGFIAYAKSRLPDRRMAFAAGHAQDVPCEEGSADVLVSGLVLNFVPDPVAGVAEFVRVVRVGGTVAAYVWDYSGEMQMMRYFWDAAADLDPSAKKLDEGRRSSICNADGLVGLFEGAGLRSVEARAIDVPTVFADFNDYWLPFLGGQAPAPQYAMSLEEERRSELRELIRERLPISSDGS
ncbi:MAG TPA: class I SAM-dependent methyltransferase, partial [Rhodothermales bacterium]|nr:class I SAM-dependent methyltransferase [Rhodothermales bacterium]